MAEAERETVDEVAEIRARYEERGVVVVATSPGQAINDIEALLDHIDALEHDAAASAARESRLEAEIQAYRDALEWAAEEGGWRLFYYETAGAPSELIWDRSDTFNVHLRSREDIQTALAAGEEATDG